MLFRLSWPGNEGMPEDMLKGMPESYSGSNPSHIFAFKLLIVVDGSLIVLWIFFKVKYDCKLDSYKTIRSLKIYI